MRFEEKGAQHDAHDEVSDAHTEVSDEIHHGRRETRRLCEVLEGIVDFVDFFGVAGRVSGRQCSQTYQCHITK